MWHWTIRFRTTWLVNRSAGLTPHLCIWHWSSWLMYKSWHSGISQGIVVYLRRVQSDILRTWCTLHNMCSTTYILYTSVYLVCTCTYKPSQQPCLYLAPAANMVGRVPMIPLFLAGNSTATFPHKCSNLASQWAAVIQLQMMAGAGKCDSNLFEVKGGCSAGESQRSLCWAETWGASRLIRQGLIGINVWLWTKYIPTMHIHNTSWYIQLGTFIHHVRL